MSYDRSELLKIGDKVTDLVHKLAGPLFEEIGLTLGDKFRVYRTKNWIKTVEKTERLLREADLPANAVPPRLLLPIIDGCSIEDNDSLQDLWAGLLATASQQTGSVSPSFAETLKQLTPGEARYLEKLYQDFQEVLKVNPHSPRTLSPYQFTERFGAPAEITSETFERLGLIEKDYDVSMKGRNMPTLPSSPEGAVRSMEPEIRYRFLITKYAMKFMDACHGPRPAARDGASPT
jgi:Abortive infection alpha